ncbi:tigger transposable element-derived 4 [Brachionus plicatilis]|uniref:Tigger transposable element-derived 4 n=1 Tax=Brachionus plicatilis TaxID=10195 RepID=A0A3M7RHT4_BRAPC|nr:tigger transposable element-derived 4 [Brachionus plicatilis]
MSDKKMVRQGIDIFTKKQILEEVEKGTSYRIIKEKYNLKHSSNICQIIKNKDRVLRKFSSLDSPFRKTLKTTKYENIDTELTQFITNCEQNGVHVKTGALREKALEIARKSGQNEFRASNGYLSNFNNRKKKGSASDSSINSEDTSYQNATCFTEENIGQKYQELISEFDPRDIFCANQFGLFWRLVPTNHVKDKLCKMGQDSHERLTIFTAVSMVGEKLPLVIVSNDERPKNSAEISKLNISYYSDPNSWMNGKIFIDIITALNDQMKLENRRIIIFINSSNDQEFEFSNIIILNLSNNAVNPLNTGVFKCLKANYRMKLCRKMFALGETKPDSDAIKLFSVIEMLSYSWDNEIKSELIVDCFKQCGFYQAKGISDDEIVSESDGCIHNELEGIYKNFIRIYPELNFNEFIDVDRDLATCEIYEDEPSNSTDEDQSKAKDTEKIEAINAIDTLKLYFVRNFTDDLKDILSTLNDLENKIYEHSLSAKK